jgi:hypothetical protein
MVREIDIPDGLVIGVEFSSLIILPITPVSLAQLGVWSARSLGIRDGIPVFISG